MLERVKHQVICTFVITLPNTTPLEAHPSAYMQQSLVLEIVRVIILMGTCKTRSATKLALCHWRSPLDESAGERVNCS